MTKEAVFIFHHRDTELTELLYFILGVSRDRQPRHSHCQVTLVKKSNVIPEDNNNPVIPEIFYRGSMDSRRKQPKLRITKFIKRFSIQEFENDVVYS